MNHESDKLRVIEADHADSLYWSDLWQYRALFWFLSWRDILVRYKQTAVGIAWSVIRPLVTMVVFTIVFGKFGKFPTPGVPYSILVFAALLPWQFFSNAISESSNSLVVNASVLTKVYFPRLIVPVSTVIVSFIDFIISFVLLMGMMLWFRVMPPSRIFVLPLLFLLLFIFSLGMGMWLSALNVRYRDFRYVVPFIIQFGLYISPVGFSSCVVPERWRLAYYINPMVGIIDGFRWAIIGRGAELFMPGLLISIALSIIIFISSILYFRHTESTFADVI